MQRGQETELWGWGHWDYLGKEKEWEGNWGGERGKKDRPDEPRCGERTGTGGNSQVIGGLTYCFEQESGLPVKAQFRRGKPESEAKANGLTEVTVRRSG